MNNLTIIGNLTHDPELRYTSSGIAVCSFTVAVNQRARKGEEPKAIYVRVTTWRNIAESCGNWLAKGRKVACSGPVDISVYTGKDNMTHAALEMTGNEVEFLTPANKGQAQAQPDEQDDGDLPEGFRD